MKLISLFALLPGMLQGQQVRHVQLKTADGVLEGVVSGDGKVRTFKGVPYAAPPVGALRWKAPQPVVPWSGVRKAVDYPPRAMQGRIYDDMVFHDSGPSEDCLYLNLWMPANPPPGKLPVMVWIHGGGFVAGASSEPRQDAGNLSKKGVLVVSMNYRLGVFGFLAHPGLAEESGRHASGNYGLLDQLAALQWVKRNIAAFGGDPDNVTLFGESAGSLSVCALMASPLAQGLFQRAIGESGAIFGSTLPLKARADAEAEGLKFAQTAFGGASIEALRARPAQEILGAALKMPQESFSPDVDGYLLPDDGLSTYAGGRQSKIPLLAGWNLDEGSFDSFFDGAAPTVANFEARAVARFGARAKAFLALYPAATDSEAKRAAQDLEGDKFMGYPTWKWLELHLGTGGRPVYRYEFDQPLPLPRDAAPGAEPRANHSGEIEFVFRTLYTENLPWRPEDHELSELISTYWTNFAKTGNPNGPGLPVWPEYAASGGYPVMHLSPHSGASADSHRGRYLFLDGIPGF